MQDSRIEFSASAHGGSDVAQGASMPPEADGKPSVETHSRYDRAYRQRRRGIYVLAGVCVAFFVVVISACYIAAAVYGYGAGFGDGKEIPARLPKTGGTGFWGDLGLLAGAIVIDLVILFVWPLPASRMENPSGDAPVAPAEEDDARNDGAWW